jgi:hypothetical protein
MGGTIMDKQLPQVRALTRAEITALREAGLDPAFRDEDLTMQFNAAMVDWILDHVYQGFDFANTPYSNCLELATATYQQTYLMSDAAAKNS